jgi:hypothetical protein
MIIPLDKLISYNENKYEFTKAMMLTIEKIGNIQEYPEEDEIKWKVVPNILKLYFDGKLQFMMNTSDVEVI